MKIEQYWSILFHVHSMGFNSINYLHCLVLLIYIYIVVGDSPMTRIMDLPKENINQELSW